MRAAGLSLRGPSAAVASVRRAAPNRGCHGEARSAAAIRSPRLLHGARNDKFICCVGRKAS